MIARDLINQLIVPLTQKDHAIDGLNRMDEFRVKCLPIVAKGKYLGLLDEDAIFSTANFDLPISEFELVHPDVMVEEGKHLFELVKIAVEHQLEMVPISDRQGTYLGVVTMSDTLSAFARISGAEIPGAIIVVSLPAKDYSLSEISRIAEEDGFKVLGSYVSLDPKDADKIKLTLKLNKTDVTRYIAALERYGHHVISKFQETEAPDTQKERLDILFKYLEM